MITKKILSWSIICAVTPIICLFAQFCQHDDSILSTVNINNSHYLSAFVLGILFDLLIFIIVFLITLALSLLED